MPVYDLYSYRKRVAEGDLPDVYVYDEIPEELRVQIDYIWRDAIGSFHNFSGHEFGAVPENNKAWHFIHKTVAREHGVYSLGGRGNEYERCKNCLIDSDSVEKVVDLIEVSFRYIDRIARKFTSPERKGRGISVIASDAITELNERFRRAGVGYQFEGWNDIPR